MFIFPHPDLLVAPIHVFFVARLFLSTAQQKKWKVYARCCCSGLTTNKSSQCAAWVDLAKQWLLRGFVVYLRYEPNSK